MHIPKLFFLSSFGFRPVWLAATLVLASATLAGGCASASAPALPHKDMTTLRTGLTRAAVIAKFGQPLSATTSKAGTPVDIFRFVQDSKSGDDIPSPIEPGDADAQAARILLAQAGVKPEKMFDGKTVTVQVNFDAQNVVVDTYLLEMK